MLRTALLVLCLLVSTACAGPTTQRVYFGTYTGGDSKGIYVAELDMKTGKVGEPRLAAELKNPSFLALHPNGKVLYAVSEVSTLDGQKTGGVSALSIDAKTGELTLLNQQPSGGGGPCHVAIDSKGRHVFAANYGGGSLIALPVDKSGKLGEATSFIQHEGSSVHARQKAPHAHAVNLDPSERYLVCSDLGLDKVMIYNYDGKTGKLTPAKSPFAKTAPAAGPRHFAYRPDGKFGYVINELNCTVTAFAHDASTGALTEVQTISTLPEGESVQRGYSTAEIFAHPTGKFLYGSNRGHDTIVVYAIDQKSGKLTLVSHHSTQGKTPRNFNLDPTGQFLLAGNQNSGTVAVYRIDQTTGSLTPTGQLVNVPRPVCVVFLPLD